MQAVISHSGALRLNLCVKSAVQVNGSGKVLAHDWSMELVDNGI